VLVYGHGDVLVSALRVKDPPWRH